MRQSRSDATSAVATRPSAQDHPRWSCDGDGNGRGIRAKFKDGDGRGTRTAFAWKPAPAPRAACSAKGGRGRGRRRLAPVPKMILSGRTTAQSAERNSPSNASPPYLLGCCTARLLCSKAVVQLGCGTARLLCSSAVVQQGCAGSLRAARQRMASRARAPTPHARTTARRRPPPLRRARPPRRRCGRGTAASRRRAPPRRACRRRAVTAVPNTQPPIYSEQRRCHPRPADVVVEAAHLPARQPHQPRRLPQPPPRVAAGRAEARAGEDLGVLQAEAHPRRAGVAGLAEAPHRVGEGPVALRGAERVEHPADLHRALDHPTHHAGVAAGSRPCETLFPFQYGETERGPGRD
eukprot:gene439-biopygen443